MAGEFERLNSKQKRNKILNYLKVCKNEWFTTRAIESSLGIGYGDSVYFLKQLVKDGLVEVKQQSKMSRDGHPRLANFYKYNADSRSYV